MYFNYRQNTLPINLDDDKYRMRERCVFFISSKLKFKPYENTACVFLTRTILLREMNIDLKKMSRGRRGVDFIPPTRRVCIEGCHTSLVAVIFGLV